MPRNAIFAPVLAAVFALAVPADAARSKGKTTNPDFTQGGKADEFHDWNLGPTGARGWIFGSKGHTAESRQILITAVAAGSPAEGQLKKGDVILGVNGKPFNDDARKQFARAITKAEEPASRGAIKLLRWREGRTSPVTLKLAALGTYSSTAPFACAKSKKIFEQGCELIAKRGFDKVSIPNSLNALALLASGNKKYQPLVAGYARLVADAKIGGYVSWHYGYAVLFLAEYVAATGDQSVMPGLKRKCLEIANGASVVGTWGHRFAMSNGRAPGYGCMNLPGLVLTLAMVVGREAGVKDPALDRAIAKSSLFLRWYVNKGGIPYGDHKPWPGHEDNGKNSIAAVLYDLLGDREAATYYAKTAVAAYDERERGHTGNFFNVLWAMPGVVRCGPAASGAYWAEQSWYYDLARDWQGGFGYQGSPQGEEEHRKYTRWDCTGAYLLSFAPPLKTLYTTGKKPSVVKPLNKAEIADTIAAGRDYFVSRKGVGYKDRTADALFTGLTSWSPIVRMRSAQALRHQQGDLVPKLIKLLASSDRNTQYGACEALGYLGERADAAAPKLRAFLRSDDPYLQFLACQSIGKLGPDAFKACAPELLRMTGVENPADPRGRAKRAAASALFGRYRGRQSRLTQSGLLEGADRKLVHAAVRAVLANEDGRTRSQVSRFYDELSDEDLMTLMPDIMKATEEIAPSGIMFASEIRVAGLRILAKHKVSEGLELIVHYARNQKKHGSQKRIVQVIKLLDGYGAHAQRVIPKLEEAAKYFDGGEENFPRNLSKGKAKLVRETIEKIKRATDKPKLMSLKG